MKNLYFLFSTFAIIEGSSLPCLPKSFGEGSTVCLCNTTYCDTMGPLNLLQPGQFQVFTTSKSGLRFQHDEQPEDMRFDQDSDDWRPDLLVTLKALGGLQYQEIIGFGGAFTDSTGYILTQQNYALRDIVIQQYFGKDGLEYNIGRVPMGGTDFSLRPYTYLKEDEIDPTLGGFNLTSEDFDYKIPLIKHAQSLNPALKLFASVWTAPPWMKTNNNYTGIGSLKVEYYQLWAEYFVKFLDEYGKQDLSFWAITTQNEPSHGRIHDMGFNCMGWTAEEQRDWIKNHLGPTLNGSLYRDIKVIMHDDQRMELLQFANTILGDPAAAQYISGIGLHWYTDFFMPPSILTETHNRFPSYWMLGTEACAGAMPFDRDVVLGSWERGANYAEDIMNDLNNYVGGWVDWNLVLDMEGGPNWARNFVDAPMISDPDAGVIYKQPMFYALGHFSKFLPEGSIRIHHSRNNDFLQGLFITSFLRPDGMVVVTLLNRMSFQRNITLFDGGNMDVEILPNSITTVLYTPPTSTPTTETPSTTSTETSSTPSTETSTSDAPKFETFTIAIMMMMRLASFILI